MANVQDVKQKASLRLSLAIQAERSLGAISVTINLEWMSFDFIYIIWLTVKTDATIYCTHYTEDILFINLIKQIMYL
jgi:hypothetical protein